MSGERNHTPSEEMCSKRVKGREEGGRRMEGRGGRSKGEGGGGGREGEGGGGGRGGWRIIISCIHVHTC